MCESCWSSASWFDETTLALCAKVLYTLCFAHVHILVIIQMGVPKHTYLHPFVCSLHFSLYNNTI